MDIRFKFVCLQTTSFSGITSFWQIELAFCLPVMIFLYLMSLIVHLNSEL